MRDVSMESTSHSVADLPTGSLAMEASPQRWTCLDALELLGQSLAMSWMPFAETAKV